MDFEAIIRLLWPVGSTADIVDRVSKVGSLFVFGTLSTAIYSRLIDHIEQQSPTGFARYTQLSRLLASIVRGLVPSCLCIDMVAVFLFIWTCKGGFIVSALIAVFIVTLSILSIIAEPFVEWFVGAMLHRLAAILKSLIGWLQQAVDWMERRSEQKGSPQQQQQLKSQPKEGKEQ